MDFELSPKERRRLHAVVQSDRDAAKVRCARALLWLDDDVGAATVARRLDVGRGTIYYWVQRYLQTGCVGDRERSGRPSTKVEMTKRFLRRIVDKAPVDTGYPGYIWTARLLHKYLRLERNLDVSTKTIRSALKGLGLSWQRPQFALARESPTWRQAKGGSSGV